MGQVSFSVPQTGQWTVTGSLTGQMLTQTVNVTEKNVIYPIELLFNSAQITVISPVGTSLLLQNGTNQLTKISTGTDVFIVTAMGTWTISGTLDGYTLNSTSVTVQDGGEYQTQLSIQIAALTVNAPSGTIVTVSGNGQQNQQTVTGSSVVFNLTALGTYTVSGTNGSFVTSTETVEITSFQPYSTTLTLSVATITVTTVEGTLVQAQNGATTLSGTATNGTITFETQTFGTWTISGTLSGYTFPQQSADVQAYQDYPVSLQPSVATLTVTAPDGTYITAQSGDTTYYGLVDGTSADILIYVLGEYTVSGENNGLVSDTQTVNVTDFTDYSTTLTIWSATITVTTPTGTTVTAVNGDTQLSEVSSGGKALFTVQQTGTWTLSASFDTQKATATVNVTDQTNYTATLRVPTIVATTVRNSVVTCSQDAEIITKTASKTKVNFYPPTLGEWTLNATLNQQSSNTVTVDVQQNKNYPLMLDYEFATISVSTLDGVEVTAKNGTIAIVQTASDGVAVFEVATMGDWTVSATVNGQALSETVNVTDTIDYEVSLIPIETATYVGAITPLSVGATYPIGASVGDYAILGGGDTYGSIQYTSVNSFDLSLSRGTPSPLLATVNSNLGAATANASYAIICMQTNITAYSATLTRTQPTALNGGCYQSSAQPVGVYALFVACLAQNYNGAATAYDESLTKYTPSSDYTSRTRNYGGHTNNYALIAGGGMATASDVVISYDENLTKLNATSLSQGMYTLTSATIDQYCIFTSSATTNVYDSSLTRTTLDPLPSFASGAATTAEKYAIFCNNNISFAFDSSLTRTTPASLQIPRGNMFAANVGQYALFAGGTKKGASISNPSNYYSNVVEAYFGE